MGMKTVPKGGTNTPPIKRSAEETKARKNLPMTSSRCIEPKKTRTQLLAVVKGSKATLRALLMAVVSSR